jgi:SAM-dependent methyltransferase
MSARDAYIAKVRAGARPSPDEALAFLRAFHAAHPGVTGASFTRYRTHEGQTSYELFAHRIACDVRALDARSGAARGVLDLACGDGVLGARLRVELGASCPLTFVDTSAEDLALAKGRFAGDPRARFLCEPAQKMSLETASIDAVACHFALMLMNDAARVVREIARVLLPGGVFHALVPSRSSAARFASPFAALIAEVLARDLPAYPALGLGDPMFGTEQGIASLFDAEAGFRASPSITFRSASMTRRRAASSLSKASIGST